MPPLRSSARTTPRKRYTIDAFEGIQDLIQESSSSEDGDEEQEDVEDDEEDADGEDEFQAGAAPSEADDEYLSGLDELGPVEEVDASDSDAGEADLDDSMSIISDAGPSRTGGTSRRGRPRKLLPPKQERTYTRGIPTDLHHNLGKEERRKWLFGLTEEDRAPVLTARDRWSCKVGLPTRKKTAGDHGGFKYNDPYLTEIENAESNWAWYDKDGGREAFEQRQVFKNLTFAEAQYYLPTDCELRTFVMGPVERRQLYSMKVRQWVAMSAAFAPAHKTGTAQNAPSTSKKKAFVLNLGARVQSLDWVPCQQGNKQYLAVTVLPRNRDDHLPLHAPEAPSFSSQSPHRSSIQIWEFSADAKRYIDDAVPPRLKMVICAAIGDIKTIKWCPVPHKNTESLGLLGCISGDGAIRILDVPQPTTSDETGTTNILIEKAAFECKPPDTVCTSFTWLTASRVAVSCANGFVAVWDIDKALRSASECPRPAIYTDISTTYIMSITSCYPSFPHLIVTTSMNGFMMLTDLRQPRPSSRAATALSPRTRIGQPFFAWLDFAHSGVSVEDNQTVRCFPLRRFFNGFATARIKGHVTSMATSMCHPYVLIGSAAGEVAGHNPLRRLTDGGKTVLFQQRWFTHEWRRPTDEEIQAANASDVDETDEANVPAMIGNDGLSRITDGFKPTTPTLHFNVPGAPKIKDSPIYSTIYEEKSAVTAVAWNPNVHVGGWAAAGMADGLLKVEDIAV